MRIAKLLLIPFALLLGACSSTYTATSDHQAAYDFSQVKSFYIIGDTENSNPMLSDIDRDRFNTAITTELSLLGMSATDKESADVLVSYFVAAKDKTKVYASPSSHIALAPRYGYSASVSNVHARSYTEGTFVLDIIDNNLQKGVWRSTLQKPIKKHQTMQEKSEQIVIQIRAMFTDLPTQSNA